MLPMQRVPTVVILALSLVLAGPGLGLANAQSDTSPPIPCERMADHPLFVTHVRFQPGGHVDDDTVLADSRAAFVHAGDELVVSATIANRMDPNCAPVFNAARTDGIHVEALYLPDPGWSNDQARAAGASHVEAADGDGCPDALAPGDACTIEIPLPTPDGADGVLADPSGEQRVRVIAQDTDPEPTTAAAERVLVVDAKPDLSPSEIRWTHPSDPDDRTTTYPGEDGTTEFEVDVWNEGTYPNWNPNGGNQYANRSSFDAPGDGDEAPDEGPAHHRFDDPRSDVGFPCTWADDGDGTLDEGEPVCSYRRGQLLDLPIHWTAHRSSDETLVAEGTDRSQVYSDMADDRHGKPDAILHTGNEAGAPAVDTVDLRTLDRTMRAGAFELSIALDEDGANGSATPETDEHDNTATRTIDILGVDLGVAEAGIQVHTPDGVRSCTRAWDPCPAGSTIIVDPTLENVGDPETDDDRTLRDRVWNAGVTLAYPGEPARVARTSDGEPAIAHHNATADTLAVPATSQGPRALFDAPLETVPSPDGGAVTVAVHLDTPQAYPEEELGPKGRIGERIESTACEDETSPGANVVCRTIYLADGAAPRIEHVDLSGPAVDPTGDPTHVLAGSDVHVTATVHEDGPLDHVTAVLEGPDGAVRHIEMDPVDPTGDRWIGNLSLAAPTGTWTLHVAADDGTHTATSPTQRLLLVPRQPDPVAAHVDAEPVTQLTGPAGKALSTQVDVSTRVSNEGTAPTLEGTTLLVRACPASPNGQAPAMDPRCEAIAKVEPPRLGPGEALTLEVAWETVDRAGTYDVCAIVDAAGEQFRSTNDAICTQVTVRFPTVATSM